MLIKNVESESESTILTRPYIWTTKRIYLFHVSLQIDLFTRSWMNVAFGNLLIFNTDIFDLMHLRLWIVFNKLIWSYLCLLLYICFCFLVHFMFILCSSRLLIVSNFKFLYVLHNLCGEIQYNNWNLHQSRLFIKFYFFK